MATLDSDATYVAAHPELQQAVEAAVSELALWRPADPLLFVAQLLANKDSTRSHGLPEPTVVSCLGGRRGGWLAARPLLRNAAPPASSATSLSVTNRANFAATQLFDRYPRPHCPPFTHAARGSILWGGTPAAAGTDRVGAQRDGAPAGGRPAGVHGEGAWGGWGARLRGG